MFCPNCGQQIPDESFFCPACGANLQNQFSSEANNMGGQGYQPFMMERNQNSTAAKIRNMLSSNLFLIICIFLSITAIPIDGLPIMAILFAIGAWISYAKAKSSDATMSLSGLRMISGTMTAVYVLYWIAVAMCALGGIMLLVSAPVMDSMKGELAAAFESPEFLEAVEAEAALLTGEESELFYKVIDWIVNNFSIIFTVMAVVIIVYAVLLTVYNAVFYRRFRKLAKNMGAAYITNNPSLLNFKGVSGLLITVGILYIVANVIMLIMSSSITMLASVCGSVAYILAAVWVKKLKKSLEAPAANSNASFEYQQYDHNAQ